MSTRDCARPNLRWGIHCGLLVLLATSFAAQAASSTTSPISAQAAKPRIVEGYGKLPLAFEPNQGQSAKEVTFLARGPGYGLFLTPTEAVLTLRKPNDAKTPPPQNELGAIKDPRLSAARAQDGRQLPPVTLHIKLVGANPHPDIAGTDALPGKVNYLRGKDQKQWRTDIPTYRKVKYAQVYPGIDLVYYGNPRQLEHDFVVAPGADPSAITLEIRGADKASIDAKGNLVLASQGGEIRLKRPVMYQEFDGRRQTVGGGYVVEPGQRVSFQVGTYDVTRPLVIDPVLVYATYLGGSLYDFSYGIAADSAGNAYVTGETDSTDFPGASSSPIQPNLSNYSYDAFVAKLNAAGSALVYATYLGGIGHYDIGYGIAVDSAGNAYVTGVTESPDFPGASSSPIDPSLTGLHPRDAFVAKLNAAGSALVYATYLGGSLPDEGYGIAVDSADNAYVTGSTRSSDFPGASSSPIQPSHGGGYDDAFVAKLNAAGSALVYATYLGGSGRGRGIAVDSAGNAYVTGETASTDFPGASSSPIQPNLSGSSDAFVAKLNAAGTAIVYATYLGGSGRGRGIAVDSASNAYVTGETASTDFPGASSSPIQPSLGSSDGSRDAFVAKLNAAGSALVYATYLGGSSDDWGSGIAVDSAGNAYVTGYTASSDFPGAASSPIQPSLSGYSDAFVAKLNAAGSALVYATYLGGSGNDGGSGIGADGGSGIAVDSAGNAYVTGLTDSTDFPGASSSPIQPTSGGRADAFVAKIGGYTFSGLIDLINTLPADTLDENLVKSLTQQLNNAAKQATKDNICAAVNILGAFQNEVEAQRGNKITDDTATLLIEQSNNLITQLLDMLPEGITCPAG